MNLQDLRTLVDYNYWARDRLLDAVDRLSLEQLNRNLGNSFPSIRDTLVHVLGAERIWCDRWEGASPRSMPDPRGFPDLDAIRRAWTDQEHRIRAVVERVGEQGVEQPIEYRTMDGKPQVQPFAQMLQHLVNHGSYHRGQVTTMLRQLGAAPPKSTDLIAFYRERAAATP
jgi:uncharacterized damage-inducible protein DinB